MVTCPIKFYLNNMIEPKKPQMTIKEMLAEEYRKCSIDPAYFMRKYMHIQHQIKGKVLFELYPFQEDTLRQFASNRFNIVLKSRQMGISTLCAGYILWVMLFNKDKNILIISIKQDTSKELVSKIKLANDSLPAWLKVECVENNMLSLKFKNGSNVRAVSSSSDAGRSLAVYLLVIDEANFIPGIQDIWASAWSTLSTGGNAILLSTPNGLGTWFHKMWTEAESKQNSFNPIRLPWHLHPERSQVWRDAQTKELGPALAGQECFSGDVIVYTSTGPQKISNINIGDLVLTHTGEYKPVVHTIKNHSKVNSIRTNKNHNLKYITDNHPLLTDKYEWKSVSSLSKSDNIMTFPTSMDISDKVSRIDMFELMTPAFFEKILCNDNTKFYINDKRHKTIHNRYLDLDYDFGLALGLYLAEGSGNRLQKTFNFNYNSELTSWPVKLRNIIREKFGVDNSSIRRINNTGHIAFFSEVISYIFDLFVIGRDCYSKRLSPTLYDNLNLEVCRGILDGYFMGDGCLKFEYPKQATSASQMLIYDMTYLLNILSINNISIRQSKSVGIGIIEGRTVNTNPQWMIKILASHNRQINNITDVSNLKDINNNTSTIKLVPTELSMDVYNLEVEEHHSYVTEYGIAHNCDCDFLSSGNNVVDLLTIEWYKKNIKQDPVECRYADRSLWIWKYPENTATYLISADTSTGEGSDFQACHVIDAVTLEQVAEYKGHITTKEFGNLLVTLAMEYNNALLVIERENTGYAVIQAVIDRGYSNLFYMTSDLKYVDPESQRSNNYYAEEKKAKAGFSTNTKTRPLIVSNIEQYIREKTILIRSSRTLSELETFIWKNGKPQASDGFNDDLIISLGIGLWVRDTALKLRQQGIDLTKASLSYINRTEVDTTPVFKINSRNAAQQTWQMSTGKPMNSPLNSPNVEDLRWLL